MTGELKYHKTQSCALKCFKIKKMPQPPKLLLIATWKLEFLEGLGIYKKFQESEL